MTPAARLARRDQSQQLLGELSDLLVLEVEKARRDTKGTAEEVEVALVVKIKAGEVKKRGSGVRPAKRMPAGWLTAGVR